MDLVTLQRNVSLEEKRNAMIAAEIASLDATYEYQSANLASIKAASDAKVADLNVQAISLSNKTQ